MERFFSILKYAWLALLLAAALPAAATQTQKFGGLLGDRVVIMDCGPGAFIVGASGSGYATLLGNLARTLSLRCRTFSGVDGTTPGATVFNASAAMTSNTVSGATDRSEGRADCTSGRMVTAMSLRSGLYIDQVASITCKAPADLRNTSGPPSLEQKALNFGGSGGTAGTMACPAGEAMYLIHGKVGEAIDSLMGSCRALQPTPPETLMETSITLPPPIDVPSGGNAGVRFNVPSSAVGGTFRFGVAAKVKPISKSRTITPPLSFRVDVLDPTGQLAIGSGTFNSVAAGDLRYVSARLSVTGNHFIRISNLTSGNAIQVTGFDVTR